MVLLRINSLNVKYGKTIALNMKTPVTFEEGDRIGIIGSNGAGKSTLIKSLLGITNYTGSVDSKISPSQMAVHMQFNEYSPNMAVKYIMEAILQTKIKKNKRLMELITFFEFEDCLKKKYQALSGGQKQRFTIILVMMQDAPLTFYDEVTSGLDFETRQKLMQKLSSWYEDKNSSFVMVSHYYEELEQLVNKLLILDHGEVVAFGEKDELFVKYCGRAIIVLDKSPKNQELTASYEKLEAPDHLIAIACNDTEVEQKLTQELVLHNVNYKRSNNDIEMIFINAKKQAGKEVCTNESK